jgi:transposase
MRANIIDLNLKLDQANQKIQKLEEKLCKNSANSSKPPSTDGFNKPEPKSLRVKSGKKIGGQLGHIGSTLIMTDTPNNTIVLKLDKCGGCHKINNKKWLRVAI